MDQIPNIFVFENLTNTEYRITCFFKINRILNMNSTIRSQLLEYQIIQTIWSNSAMNTYETNAMALIQVFDFPQLLLGISNVV